MVIKKIGLAPIDAPDNLSDRIHTASRIPPGADRPPSGGRALGHQQLLSVPDRTGVRAVATPGVARAYTVGERKLKFLLAAPLAVRAIMEQ